MKTYLTLPAAAALSLAVMAAAPQQAQAAGCIKGAIVGAAAGYAAGHTFLGAAGGCVAGRALAKKQEADRLREQQMRDHGYGRNQPGGAVLKGPAIPAGPTTRAAVTR